MKNLMSLVLSAALVLAVVSAACAGDCYKIKREYYTPYGKVKVKEYRCPAYGYYPYYGYPHYYVPPCSYAGYGPYYGSYYHNPYWSTPAYWSPSPYGGGCRVEID